MVYTSKPVDEAALREGRCAGALYAVMVGAGCDVAVVDSGVARFMQIDYLAAKSNVGKFTWTVRAFPLLVSCQDPCYATCRGHGCTA